MTANLQRMDCPVGADARVKMSGYLVYKRDYYEVLGVSKNADEKQIKSAYRKLAMANHPDRNPDDEAAAERFREASEAYEVLKDGEKRAAYDQLGHALNSLPDLVAAAVLVAAVVVADFLIFLSRCSANSRPTLRRRCSAWRGYAL